MNQQPVNNCTNCQDLNYEVITLTKDKVDLEYLFTSSERKLKALQQEHDNLQESFNKLKEDLRKSESSRSLKTDQNDELTNKVLELSEKFACLDTDNKVMRMRMKSFEEEKESLIQENERLSKELAPYKGSEAIRTGQEFSEKESKKLKIKIEELEAYVKRLKEEKENEEKEKDYMRGLLAAEHTRHNEEITKYKKMVGGAIEDKEERKERKERLKRNVKEGSEEEEDISACKIDAESVTDLLRGEDWKISVKDPADYQRRVNEKSVKIAAIGDEETGKTFILKRLLGYEDFDGKRIKTNGLCVLYPKEENKLLMAFDTPGKNMIVQTELVKKELEAYIKAKGLRGEEVEKLVSGGKILAEKIIQEFVMKKVEILLIVVRKLRREDQKFINKIKERKDLNGKRIIIVHNLMDMTEIDDVKEVIQEDIINIFDAYERGIDVPHKQGNQAVYSEGGVCKIDHVVMAKEDSPAGEFYNETAITYLKQVISVGSLSSNFDFIQEFTENVAKSLKDYIMPTGKTSEEMLLMKLNDEQVPFGLKLARPEECVMKVDCMEAIEEVEKVIKGNSLEFPYTVKMTKKRNEKEGEDERYIKIEFELTGKCADKDIKRRVEIKDNKVVIKVKGKSDDNMKRGSEEEEICFNNRKFGEFYIVTDPIELKDCTAHMDDKGIISSDVPGLKVISWKLYPLSDDHNDSF